MFNIVRDICQHSWSIETDGIVKLMTFDLVVTVKRSTIPSKYVNLRSGSYGCQGASFPVLQNSVIVRNWYFLINFLPKRDIPRRLNRQLNRFKPDQLHRTSPFSPNRPCRRSQVLFTAVLYVLTASLCICVYHNRLDRFREWQYHTWRARIWMWS